MTNFFAEPSRRHVYLLTVLVIVIALATRLLIVLNNQPYQSPDSQTYEQVAGNIYQNFCVSRSDPASAECKPSWGGNHLPGYPAMIALAWLIGGKNLFIVLVLQSVLASLAVGRLAFAVFVYTKRSDMALLAGVVLALSLLEAAYARSVHTEALAIATTEWTLAELILSLAERRLRVLALAIPLTASIFVRHDGILLCLLVAGVGFYLHPIRTALARGAVLALMVALPLGAWMLRSIALGLPYFPPIATAGHEWVPPTHMIGWGMTWVETPEQEAQYVFPILDGHYGLVKIPQSVYVSSAEREEVESLIAVLSKQDGMPAPQEADDAFARLTTIRRLSYPATTLVYKPFVRTIAAWSDFYASYAWPVSFAQADAFRIADTIKRQGVAGAASVILAYPVKAAEKAAINGYKFVVLGIFLLAIVYRRRPSFRTVSISEILALTAGYAIIRTFALVSGLLPTFEVRILVEAMPGLEIASAIAIMCWIDARQALDAAGPIKPQTIL